MHIDDFQQYLHTERRYSSHTVSAYLRDVNQLLEFVADTIDVSVGDLQSRHVRNWMVQLLEKGDSPRTVNRKLSANRSYFKYLRRSEYVSNNPFKSVVGPKVGLRLPETVRESEMNSLLDASHSVQGFESVRDLLMVSFLYHLGLRRSELISIQLPDLDRSRKTLTVHGKGNKVRLLPLSPEIITILDLYCDQRAKLKQESLRLFLTKSGNPIYPKLVYRVVTRRIGEVSTIAKRSPHVLRHSFATHLSDEGADINAVKELLGHSSLASTQIYTHTSISKLKKAYQQAHPKAKT